MKVQSSKFKIQKTKTSGLFLGDALQVMDGLLEEGQAGEVKLIVTDPPFFTQQQQMRRELAYSDCWGSLGEYLSWLREILVRSHALLSETGSIFLHLDWRASHHGRVLLDEIFGPGGEPGAAGFRNEIIWCYTGPGSPGMGQFNRKHDTILWHSKGTRWTFNREAVRVAHHRKTKENFKRDLEGSGFRIQNPKFKIQKEDKNNGRYELAEGKVPEDWWVIPVAARFPVDGVQRVGYPTEKPLALVERIIRAASNEGDLVADFLCGGGTVPAACARLGRHWWAGDANAQAVAITAERLKRITGEGANYQ